MTAIEAVAATHPDDRTQVGVAARVLVSLATVIVVLAAAMLPLLTPPFTHAALDAAGSARWLGRSAAEAQLLSDESVEELLLGPGSFALVGPDGSVFFDASERRHLGDARLLLLGFLILAGLSLAGILLTFRREGRPGRATIWTAVAAGGAVVAITVAALGALSLVAFEPLLSFFHQILFPQGGWAFDPTTQRLVQLYPMAFWQVAAGALSTLVIVIGSMTWWLARSHSRSA